MLKGKVEKYDISRGCGIIVDCSTGEQLTVYANYINLNKGETLKEGQEVEYDKESTSHRNWAVNVKLFATT
jgi:cold shock CspA family protein